MRPRRQTPRPSTQLLLSTFSSLKNLLQVLIRETSPAVLRAPQRTMDPSPDAGSVAGIGGTCRLAENPDPCRRDGADYEGGLQPRQSGWFGFSRSPSSQ